MTPGANNDGYWNMAHVAIQWENVQDCLDVMYPDVMYIMSFDNSSNHPAKREHAKDAKSMNYRYAGLQPDPDGMRVCRYEGAEKYENEWSLPDGAPQPTNFGENNRGPWYLKDDAERLKRKHDHYKPEKERDRTKKDFIEELKKLEHPPENLEQRSLRTLKELARRNNISWKVTDQKLVHGWVGRPKGTLQILAERSLIEIEGMTQRSYSKAFCSAMLDLCPDFQEEATLLEHLAQQRGDLPTAHAKPSSVPSFNDLIEELDSNTAASNDVEEEEETPSVSDSKYYDILGIPTTASQAEIRRGYVRKAANCHPDNHPDNEHMHDLYSKVGNAYAILSNEKAKKYYDKNGPRTYPKFKVLFSAKGYPDTAGYGIEYIWALIKNSLLRMSLDDKKGAEKFRKAFDVALSKITIWGVRGCAKKCRQYNLAYLVSHANQLAARRAENPTDPDNNSPETNLYSIDDMMKESLDPVSYKTLNNTRDSFKTHRNVADMQGAAESLRQIIQGTY